MLIGAQVGQAGGLLAALRRAEEMGAPAIQLFAQNNRQWREPDPDADVFRAFRRAAAISPVVSATVCHAPYLINLISPDESTRDRSHTSLVANLGAATTMGAVALVLHPGSHRGIDVSSALPRVAAGVVEALDGVRSREGSVCDLLLENTAGAGGTVGRTFAELAEIIAAAGGDRRIGVCLDTQHLWASGTDYGTRRRADQVVRRLCDEIGLERLRCLHLNDSKVGLGSRQDRHENIGEGAIGARALAFLIGHPALQDLPAILEVPGSLGRGPGAADLASARRVHQRGLAYWSRPAAR